MVLSKVAYVGATPRTRGAWELDVDPALSYVYDNGLKFGVVHALVDNFWVPQTAQASREDFDQTFAQLRQEDLLKHSILSTFYLYANQPMPKIDANTLGFSEDEFSEEEYYKAWTLSRIANLPLSRTYRSHTVSDWIRGMLNTYYRTHSILIPKTEELRLGSTKQYVTGALTIAPESGTYFNMVVLDFESLYPGVIDVYNLSYETVRCPHQECLDNLVPGLDYHICRQRRGIYSAMVGALRNLRIHYFRPLTKSHQGESQEYKVAKAATEILKLLLVSSYGVTIRIHGLASPLLGDAITAYGRHVLQSTFDRAKDRGLRPKYGDTDSVFLDNPSDDNVDQFIREVKDNVGLELAYERRYAVCVLSAAKKAYFGILPDGQPEIKGLTVAKSNSPRFFLETFQNCVLSLSQGRNSLQSFNEAKKKVQDIVTESLTRLRRGKVPLEDLEYRVELREDPVAKSQARTLAQPYQAALLLRENGQLVSKRRGIGFVKVRPFKHKGRTFTVKPLSLVSIGEVNVEDYIRNLTTSLAQTFEPMGIKLRSQLEPSLSDFAA